MADMTTGTEDGVFGVTIDFDEDDAPSGPIDVEIRVKYRFIADLSTEWPEIAEHDEWDAANPEAGWRFDIEGRSPGDEEWSELVTGAADTLPEAVAIAIYMIETQLPGDLRRSASHELADATKTFDAEFGGAFDLAVGNPELVPDDLQVDRVNHEPNDEH